MTYLEQYDAVPEEQAAQKIGLVSRWINTDWRPFFKELRESRPIFRTPGFTLVTHFPDVVEVLSREQVFSVRLYQPKMDPVVDGPFMLARDNTPVNWREKSIMQTMLQLEDLPSVRAMSGDFTEDALDRFAEQGRIEVVSQIGRYVPVRVCGAYFGFPGPNLETMFRWSKATQSDMFKNLQNDPTVHDAAVQAGGEMRTYLAELLEEKRRDNAAKDPTKASGMPPCEDTFQRLIRTHFPSEIGFDDHRLLANMAGLLIGSVETASQAIVQALEQILFRRDVHAEASAAAREVDPSHFDKYVWEALRFNPINPLIFRFCEEDYILAAGTPRETRIPKGTIIFACTASAMFDSVVLPDPETFNINRATFIRLHFGYGHHTCLGRYVGLVQIPEVIRRILLRPNVRLLPPPEGAIDFQSGPFPERFNIAYGAPSPLTAATDGEEEEL
jgi:cytochrome P450